MGATAFYGWPYPDPGSDVDVPGDIKALADELELMKNGFQIPAGNLVVGDTTKEVAQGQISIPMKVSPDTGDLRLLLSSAHAGIMTLLVNGAEKNRILMDDTGAVKTRLDASGPYRPFPFACSAGMASIVIGTSATSGSIVVNLPASGGNRFTQTPIVVASGSTSNAWMGLAGGISATQFTAQIRNIDATPGTGTFGVQWFAVQMTPTSTPGGGPALRDADVIDGYVRSVSTCHTDGCENADISIDGYGPPGGDYVCGPCGMPIEDVVDNPKKRR
jgi:hypothetical protein